MLLDDYYQQMLHAPVPQPEAEKTPGQPGQAQGEKKTERKRFGWGRRK
jgi:hypothetical protein